MTYKLCDGTEVTGDVAEVCATLAAHDPLEDQRLRQMNDSETLAELLLWRPEHRWCEETQRLIVPTGLDNFVERPKGDVEEMVRAFNDARWVWALDQIDCAERDNDKVRAKVAKAWSKYVERAGSKASVSGVAAMFRNAATIRAERLNQEPEVIGTPLGVVNMDDGTLYTDGDEWGARAWHVTKRTRANVESRFVNDLEYDPRWDDFISEIMCGDEERAAYLQRALGYSMLGGNPEECMFVAYGATTRNGKGTLLESVAWALGDYARSVDRDYLMYGGRATSGPDEETASLAGVRLVTISEPTEGKRLDEGKVKALTGGDSISCRHMYGTQFEFRPQFTMWMSCNRLPLVSDTTVFTSGRIRVIPFERHFDEGEQDTGLKARFRDERGAFTVLTWLLEGYIEYARVGLAEPESVRQATLAYAGVGGSTLRRFVDQHCELGRGLRVSVKDFTDYYKAFCDSIDEPALTAQKMRRELEGMAVSKGKGTHGTRVYRGIGLCEGVATVLPLSATQGGEVAAEGGRGRVRLAVV